MEMSIRFPGLNLVLEYVPASFTIFGMEFTIYGVLIAIGALLGMGLVVLEAGRNHQDTNKYLDLSIISLAASVIGSRLFYVIFSWGLYQGNPMGIFDLRNGGYVFYGGLLFGILAAVIFCRVVKAPFWEMADNLCLGVLLGQVIGRWGNFFNRESFGEYADNIFSMQLPLTAVRAGEVTTAMREKLQTVDGGTWILVQPLFFYESLWCLLVLLMLMMLLRKKAFQGEIFLRYLAGYGLGRTVLQWFRTDKILFPGTGVDVSLVISVILFVLCTVVVAVKRVMSRKRAKVRMRRIEKDQQAEKEAEQQRENVAENLETETVQGEKNGSERDTEERGSSSESVTFAATAGGTEEAGQPDQEQERSSEESGGQPKS